MLKNLSIAAFLAFKSIRRGNIASTVLIIFILSLAFVNLVFISGVLNGVLEAINRQVRTNLVSDIVIEPQEEPTKKDFIIHAHTLQDDIEQIPGVLAATRHYKLGGTFSYDKDKNGKPKRRTGEVVGVDPEKEALVSQIAKSMVEGEYLEEGETDQIVLGTELAGGSLASFVEQNDLGGARIGDRLTLTYANGMSRDYTVKGIFKVQFGFVDRLAFITAKEAESILSINDSASQILVKTKGQKDEESYIKSIKTLAPNLRVRPWGDYVGALANVSKSFDVIALIISSIGLAVAAITLFILVYVDVVHKRRQIGILKAIGIKEGIIIYSYIFQALFYALSGVVIGVLLTIYLLEPYFTAHPLQLPVGKASLAVDRSLLVYNTVSLIIAAAISGFIPSYRAARENILKAIWGT